MKIRCLFGHDWRELPWFKSKAGSADNWSNPKKICMRCFKQWRVKYVWVVHSIEGPGWRYYLPPFWEGQTPPEGFATWKEYHEQRTDRAVHNLTRSRPKLTVPRLASPAPKRKITPNMRKQMNKGK